MGSSDFNNKLPFKLDGINLQDYYYNDDKKVHKYKLEDKSGKLAIPKLQGVKGSDKYEMVKKEWRKNYHKQHHGFIFSRQRKNKNMHFSLL